MDIHLVCRQCISWRSLGKFTLVVKSMYTGKKDWLMVIILSLRRVTWLSLMHAFKTYGENLFNDFGIKVVTDRHQLGGFIGEKIDKDEYVGYKVQKWWIGDYNKYRRCFSWTVFITIFSHGY